MINNIYTIKKSTLISKPITEEIIPAIANLNPSLFWAILIIPRIKSIIPTIIEYIIEKKSIQDIIPKTNDEIDIESFFFDSLFTITGFCVLDNFVLLLSLFII